MSAVSGFRLRAPPSAAFGVREHRGRTSAVERKVAEPALAIEQQTRLESVTMQANHLHRRVALRFRIGPAGLCCGQRSPSYG